MFCIHRCAAEPLGRGALAVSGADLVVYVLSSLRDQPLLPSSSSSWFEHHVTTSR